MWTVAESQGDVLSLVLSRIRLESFVTCAFDLGGVWAIEFPRSDALRFKFISRGECWLHVEGVETIYHLGAGDCFLVSPGRKFVLSKGVEATGKERAEELVLARRNDRIIVHNGGGDTFSLGAVFRFQGHFSNFVLASIPPVIHIPADLDQAAILRWGLDRFAAEFHGGSVGRALMMSNLAPIILLQTLRIHLNSKNNIRSWLLALLHPSLSKAMEAIHNDYHKNWTLDSLAKLSGFSRAGFALSFKNYTGATPIDYLVKWRMQMACGLLQQGKLGAAGVAHAVGYESESAFSNAFKKIIGVRPGAYQRNSNAGFE